MKILIMTGKFGMGHWSASQSLRLQLLSSFPDAEVTVEDFFSYAMPDLSEAMYKGFSLLVTRGGGLYNLYYKATENVATKMRPPLEDFLLGRFAQLLSEREADMVIATHPSCAQVVSAYKEDTGSALPLVTCITDLSSHSEWINEGTDCYLVGFPEIRNQLAEKGVDPQRILVTGIPVKPEFKASARRGGEQERRLLIMGGGLGLLPKKDSFYGDLNGLTGVKTTLITGGNQKLYERLFGKYENIEVLGFTDRVYDYMGQADLILSKPGGITLFESIFSELPILAWEPFLQQERNNAQFIVRYQLGRIAAKEPEACVDAIQKLIYDEDALSRMSENMRCLKGQLEVRSLEHMLTLLSVETKEVCA